MKIQKRKLAIPIVLGLVVFALFTHEIGIEQLQALLRNVNKHLVLLVVLFNLGNLLFFTLSWNALLTVKPSFLRLFRIYLVGVFVNNITPSFGAGGEPVKALLIGNATGVKSSGCFATVLTQRMLNMLPFIVVAIIGLVFLFLRRNLKPWEGVALSFIILLAIFTLFLLVYLYFRKEKLERFTHAVVKKFTPLIRVFKRNFNYEEYVHEVDESIDVFHAELKRISQNRQQLTVAMVYSFIGWMFDVAAAYTVFLALDYRINFGILTMSYTIAMVVGLIPLFLPGGLGAVDGVMALLYISSGVPKETALLSTLLYRLVAYWLNTVMGATSAIAEHISLEK
jgi:hypothetical protein